MIIRTTHAAAHVHCDMINIDPIPLKRKAEAA